MHLDSKIAIVTGSDSGIGQAIAEEFAKAGADVCVTFHTDREGASETGRRVEATGRRALVAQLDVRDVAAVDALFSRVAAELGTPDILVNNAGKGMGGKTAVGDLPEDQLDVILDTNQKAHCIAPAPSSGCGGRTAAAGASSTFRRWRSTCRPRTPRPMEWPRPVSARSAAASRSSSRKTAST